MLRQQDHIARWGSEQFMVLLPETGAEGGLSAGERVRSEIARSSYLYDGQKIDFTLTFGVAVFDPSTGLAHCLSQVTDAVVRGKEEGMDRIVIAG